MTRFLPFHYPKWYYEFPSVTRSGYKRQKGIEAEIVAVDRRETGSVLDLLKKDLKEADKLKFNQ